MVAYFLSRWVCNELILIYITRPGYISRASVLSFSLVNAIVRSKSPNQLYSPAENKSLTRNPLPAAPLGKHCGVLQTTACALFHIAFSSTAFLFVLRVRAIFSHNKYVVTFCFILWLSVLATSATVATVRGSSPLGPTPFCYPKPTKSYISSSPITLAISDTFVFLAISWHLLANSWFCIERRPSLKDIVLGKYLPAFSRALLQDGQVYYLWVILYSLGEVLK